MKAPVANSEMLHKSSVAVRATGWFRLTLGRIRYFVHPYTFCLLFVFEIFWGKTAPPIIYSVLMAEVLRQNNDIRKSSLLCLVIGISNRFSS